MLLFFIDDCEYWEAAWLKQQEILPLQFPSPNGSMRWTGAALSRLFRSAVMQLQLRFFRRRNAALSPRFSMMQAVFAATSSLGGSPWGERSSLSSRACCFCKNLSQSRADQAHAAHASLRGWRLQLSSSGSLRRRQLPAADGFSAWTARARLGWRRIHPRGATTPRAVQAAGGPRRSRTGNHLHHTLPACERLARLLPRESAARREPRAPRHALHLGHNFSRRKMTGRAVNRFGER